MAVRSGIQWQECEMSEAARPKQQWVMWRTRQAAVTQYGERSDCSGSSMGSIAARHHGEQCRTKDSGSSTCGTRKRRCSEQLFSKFGTAVDVHSRVTEGSKFWAMS